MNAIERDIALAHLRSIYESLSTATPDGIAAAPEPVSASSHEQTSDAEVVVPAAETVEEQIEEPAVVEEPAVMEVPSEESAVERAENEDEYEAEDNTVSSDDENNRQQSIIADPLDIDLLLGLTENDMPSQEQESAYAEQEQDRNMDEPESATEHDTRTHDADISRTAHEDAAQLPVEDMSETGPDRTPPAESGAEDEHARQEAAGERELPAEPEIAKTSEQAPHTSVMAGLFDMEQIPVRAKRRRNVMISLYDDEPKKFDVAPQTQPAPEPENSPEFESISEPEDEPAYPTPVIDGSKHMPAEQAQEISSESDAEKYAAQQAESHSHESGSPSSESKHFSATVTPPAEQPTRLADVLGGGITTLADTLAGEHHAARTVASSHIDSLRSAIGINDRFLMIRDLFNGNEQMFEDTITTLEEFDDLDECMIYIVENFAWNPDSDGARLLTDIIQRKLS